MPAPPSPKRVSLATAVALILLTAGWIYLVIIRNWLGSRAASVGFIAFALIYGLAVWNIPALRKDGPSTSAHFALGLIAGVLAGLVAGLLSGRTPLLAYLMSGGLSGVLWVWLGQFLRTPFGAAPSPPYSKE